MNAIEILDLMDEMLDKAWNMPMSNGKCVINADRMRELIDDIKRNLPQEIKQARLIVQDRTDILSDAHKEADQLVKAAEEKARRLVDQNEITKVAKQNAMEMVQNAQAQARSLKKAANEYVDELLGKNERQLLEAANQVKRVRAALHTPQNSAHNK